MEAVDWNLVVSGVMIVVAVLTVVYANRNHRKLLSATMLLDFSKRYQDIILSIPDDGEPSLRHVMLYFDLCSEEYRLYKKGLVDKATWELWKDGMRECVGGDTVYRDMWNDCREYYSSDDFPEFFDKMFR